mgnify:CR=1 FL=1
MVLLVLAGIWAAVLIPPAVRARAEGRPGDSIRNFKRQQSVLRRTGPFGYTVRVLPQHAGLANDAELGLVVNA